MEVAPACVAAATALRDAERALREMRPFEHAHRAVPDDRFCCREILAEQIDRFRADVEAHSCLSGVCAMSVVFVSVRIGRFEPDVIDGKQKIEIFRAWLRSIRLLREIEFVVFDERLPYRDALRFEKRVGHGAADQHGVGELHQVLYDFDFVGDFRAAEDGDERALGIARWLCPCRRVLFPSGGRRRLA